MRRYQLVRSRRVVLHESLDLFVQLVELRQLDSGNLLPIMALCHDAKAVDFLREAVHVLLHALHPDFPLTPGIADSRNQGVDPRLLHPGFDGPHLLQHVPFFVVPKPGQLLSLDHCDAILLFLF